MAVVVWCWVLFLVVGLMMCGEEGERCEYGGSKWEF